MESPYDLNPLESRLGYFFKDTSLLDAALRHRSFTHSRKGETDAEPRLIDNQRLEFLGDAVLSVAISTRLYRLFPDLKEGPLTKMRAGLVNGIQLANIARKLDLAQFLAIGPGEEKSGGRDKNSILADALEAIIGAIYLDSGLAEASKTIELIFGDLINKSYTEDLLEDYKTKLQEVTQEFFLQTPRYKVTTINEDGELPMFEATLSLDKEELAVGRGPSKKEAEQSAAKSALDTLNSRIADSS